MLDVNRLLGQNVLLNFITGRYHQPRLEERVFLFLDMVGSTGIAERLGTLAFDRFIIDLTGPIVAARGEIHRYIGDELIATWKLEEGIADARRVAACFAAMDQLARLAPAYRREFGVAVNFRAGRGGKGLFGLARPMEILGWRTARLCRRWGRWRAILGGGSDDDEQVRWRGCAGLARARRSEKSWRPREDIGFLVRTMA